MKDSDAMCTVVVSLAPEDQVPLLLLGIRDEFTGRPWQPPARHWPGSPLIGGLDEQAGGTWLAVHPDRPRVACILNGRGQFAPPTHRRSRGDLPLRAAAEGQPALRNLRDDPEILARYDPFYLVCADPAAVLLLGWDGRRATLTELGPATHVLTNAGHRYPPDHATADAKTAEPDPKAVRFGPKFAAIAYALRPTAKPSNISPNSAATFAKVKMFWISAPVFTPKILITESAMTSRMAIRFCVFKPTSMLPSTMGPR